MPDRRRPWLQLLRTPGLGPVRIQRLLDAFGHPDRALSASPRERERAGIPASVAAALDAVPAAVDDDLRWLDASPDRHLITRDDSAYPEVLLQIPTPPPALFVTGDPEVLKLPQLAIVGSRNPTPQGKENAQAFARSLASRGLTITSGLALGIDGEAHRGALDAGGLTIAVCGTGLDRVYPAAHHDLAHQIAAEGALVSEWPPGTPPKAEHFPRRNRIISGLALGVLVVEAATESGSLITARDAMEQNRDVFAIPGSIHNVLARGCHRLIRDGATLVETAEDILEPLAGRINWVPGAKDTSAKPPPPSQDNRYDADYRRLLEAMGDSPVSLNQLVDRTGLTVEAVSSMLLVLELDGAIAPGSSGLFMRLSSAH
ncbi:DNA-processing protein DprA [uncultured Abyssibacter sp.]|uniref:DNA-processing protein DprA n=1 Tax=uncultured Abyssibacter sp. TaxID=2320202 RepID=UPI0032B2269E